MLPQPAAPPDAVTSSQSQGPQTSGLTVEERRHLMVWTDSARESGIDATEDLRLRPWPLPVSAAVIGVFRTGEGMASWLVVGQNGLWTVVSVREGNVMATRPTLADALTVIHRPLPATRGATGGGRRIPRIPMGVNRSTDE